VVKRELVKPSFSLSDFPGSSNVGRMEPLVAEDYLPIVDAALAEDVGTGDITTRATVAADRMGMVAMVAREDLIICALPVAVAVFTRLSSEVTSTALVREGEQVIAGQALLRLEGPVAPMLTGERVALNLVQRLSGVATLTRQFVDAVRDTTAVILDTRKTTPGLRRLEKYAVRCGGGQNHRRGLYDAILIKDNHLAALRGQEPDPVTAAVRRARGLFPGHLIEVETDTQEQVEQALAAGADVILLDNMSPSQLRLAVQQIRGRARTEASGGVNLANVRTIAETGVDFISVGAVTHSARAMDIGLDWNSG
jgi:nicotinate-nucleotide pyrophosphorylase (carboxylating)